MIDHPHSVHTFDEFKNRFLDSIPKGVELKIKTTTTLIKPTEAAYTLTASDDYLHYTESGPNPIHYEVDFKKNKIKFNGEPFPNTTFVHIIPSILRAGKDLLEQKAKLTIKD